MKIGVVACEIMRHELEHLLPSFPEVSDVIFLEAALHCSLDRMRATVLEKMRSLQDSVDVIFLGYGFCRSMRGIEDEMEIPVVMPQMDDCIQILMTPQKYATEIRKEVGTWFMSPGWAEIGADMVIKELKLDRAVRYGKDPLEMAKRLFVTYRRGLCLDTGVGDHERFMAQAKQFCELFQLAMEKTEGTLDILRQHLQIAREVGRRQEQRRQEQARHHPRSES
jgi:hypothetical protein